MSSESKQPLSVLIIEDEELIANNYAEGFTQAGYRVLGVAGNASEAIRLADAHRPDLIIADVHLQGPDDGFMATLMIREVISQSIPVIFVSGYEPTGMITDLPRSSFFRKPLDIKKLLSEMQKFRNGNHS